MSLKRNIKIINIRNKEGKRRNGMKDKKDWRKGKKK